MTAEKNNIPSLILKEEEIKKHNYTSYFQEKVLDNEQNPTKITYITKEGTYYFLTTSIKDKERILAKFFRSILIDSKRYFVVRIPANKKDRICFQNMMNNLDIKRTRELTISFESNLQFRSKTEKNIPRLWADKLPLIEKYFQHNNNSCTVYQPPVIPIFPLYCIAYNPCVEKFVYKYCELLYDSKEVYTFYAYAVCSHVMFSCGIHKQTQVNTVIASIKDIRKLLPDNLNTDRFIQESNKKIEIPVKVTRIEDKRGLLKFTFDTSRILSCYRNLQFLQIPIKLLPKCFRSDAFGKNGLAYFLMILWALHNKRNAMNYTPSKIIKLAKINTKRGTKYTINAINKPLEFLKKIKVIRAFTPLTKEKLLKDEAIVFYLNNLLYWVEPEN